MKKALITGITGQDGSYLTEFLLTKGYEVHGIIRRASNFNTNRIDHIYRDPHEENVKLKLHYGDLSDAGLITDLIYNIHPDEIYHLAAQSHVRVSFDMPEYTGDITGLGTTRLLESLRRSGVKTRFYQASTSELFGAAPPPQSELTPFQPQSPYAIAKMYAYWMTINYREAYNIFACNGILFNHESPRRGEVFVTRKITRAIARMITGKQKKLFLGNIEAKRDWGFAPEYVEMMWMMLQADKAEDYCVGTGESHSIREFIETAFNYINIEIEWKDSGVFEKGIIKSIDKKYEPYVKTGDILIEIDPKYFRPTEVDFLLANINKAKKQLGWEPKVNFSELVKVMMDYDIIISGGIAPGQGIKAVKNKGINWTNHELVDMEKISNEV